jgi:hypothetical protein
MAKHEDKQGKKDGSEKERDLREFLKRQPPETEKRLKKALKERGLWNDAT